MDSIKILTLLFLSLAFVGLAPDRSLGQTKKTVILVRHAEKDAVQSEMSGDPELSIAGKERADRLVKKIGKYRVGAVYSTDARRTRDTAAPMANRRHLKVEIYDPRKQEELMNQIMASKTKRFLIVGHSNTIPGLANLFMKKDLFKPLDEDEYGTIWIIRLNKGELPKLEVLEY